MFTPRCRLFSFAALIVLIGCAQNPPVGKWQGPSAAPASSVQPWTYGERSGHVLISSHYRIYTTIDDAPELEKNLPRLMEGALDQYREMSGGVKSPSATSSQMLCFLFGQRDDWADFTSRNTGQDAGVYLQINRGGYTIGDRYVAYYVGDVGTYSVAAHEGWHQYCSRNFKGRLPPFLEEGIACLFESVRWENDLPQWNLSVNTNRALALREALEAKQLWPLKQLVMMHAGQIVDGPPQDVEAFYAQSWAFARFLREADGGKRRAALQRLIAETAAGTVKDPTNSHQRSNAPWNRESVRPMLETYLGENFDEIDLQYRVFLHQIVYKEMSMQGRS